VNLNKLCFLLLVSLAFGQDTLSVAEFCSYKMKDGSVQLLLTKNIKDPLPKKWNSFHDVFCDGKSWHNGNQIQIGEYSLPLQEKWRCTTLTEIVSADKCVYPKDGKPFFDIPYISLSETESITCYGDHVDKMISVSYGNMINGTVKMLAYRLRTNYSRDANGNEQSSTYRQEHEFVHPFKARIVGGCPAGVKPK